MDGPEGTDSGGTIEPVSADDPPVLDELDAYRNEDLVTLTGRAPDGNTITITVTGTSSTEEYIAVASDSVFAVDIGLERGTDVQIVAENSNGTSNTVTTHACENWDAYEIDAVQGDDYGDDCSLNPVVISEAFTDVQEVSLITGNSLSDGDEDWYQVVTIDDPTIENNFGFENYNFQVRFLEGESRYSLEVYRDGCGADVLECGEESYSEYSFSAEDVEPDETGSIPPDPRACGGPADNDCADFSATYALRIRRTDGQLDCNHYQLEVSNGL